MLETGSNLTELTFEELKEVDGGFIITAMAFIGFQVGFKVGYEAMQTVIETIEKFR